MFGIENYTEKIGKFMQKVSGTVFIGLGLQLAFKRN